MISLGVNDDSIKAREAVGKITRIVAATIRKGMSHVSLITDQSVDNMIPKIYSTKAGRQVMNAMKAAGTSSFPAMYSNRPIGLEK